MYGLFVSDVASLKHCRQFCFGQGILLSLQSNSWVRIGRTLQSFPPSKRSGRLSTHSAFQLGRTTLIGQIRRYDGKAHQQSSCRHLLSSLHLLTIILFGLPWRTFTMSWPLQPGVWLLRRLRPPSRTLAFSRPAFAGQAVSEFPNSKRRYV